MAKDLKEFEELLELLLLEKAEDLEQFKQKILNLSLEERKDQGYSWYPLQVIKSGYTYGERAYVVVERTSKLNEPHQFRSGKIVQLFTKQAAVKRPEQSGVIQYLDRNKMKIILNSKDLPDWLGLGLIGVDLLFDDTTYQEMEKALKKVMKASKDRLAEIRDILMGRQQSKADIFIQPKDIITLNPSQNKAVHAISTTLDVAIIHGPPGTGKTTTLVQAIKKTVEKENTVLVTAPSNTAVDLLTERLHDQGLRVVRVGNISRVDESIIRHTLDVQMSQHPDAKNIKKVKIQAAEARRNARKYRRKFGAQEYQERKQSYKEAGELMAWANQLEERLIHQILDGAQVITCTLVGSVSRVLDHKKFRTVFIDEAAQALEPATWIPITKASRVVLTGDPFQLPPTVKSRSAAKLGFNITLIEKSLQRLDQTYLLNTQYRMNEKIMGFSNQQFYDNHLKADDSVKDHQLNVPSNQPLVFIDTAGCGFEEKIQEAFQSRYNPEEFQILCEHLYRLVEEHKEQALPSIAIISPYREQVIHIKKELEEDHILQEIDITVNTIDGFQGQEKDVVYISLVRSNGKSDIGFLGDTRRMNVAMTRARKQLIIVGDSATIGGHSFYEAFLSYCEKNGQYQTAWEYMQ